MLARLTRALQLEAERFGNIEGNGMPPLVKRSFALISDQSAHPHVEGFQIEIHDPRVRNRVFTVTVVEERSR